MYDCPVCRVPLHGHEEVCPSCGTRQQVRQSSGGYGSKVPPAPGVNWMPFVITIVVIGVGLFIMAQFTWIGQLLREGPRQEDPMEKMTYIQARQIIESELSKNLGAVGASGKFEWKSGENPVDKNLDQNVELSVETELQDPNQRRNIVDPVKPYLEKAKITTLTMKDKKSKATWTYQVQAGAAPSAPEGGADGAQ